MMMNNAGPIPAEIPQVAIHYLANLVPFPQDFSLADCFQGEHPAGRIPSGLLALHGLISTIYQTGANTPDILIPPDHARRPKGLKDVDFTTYPRLLFALGLFGKLEDNKGQTVLWVETKDLSDFCDRARIRSYEPFFTVLERFGLVFLPSQPLQFAYPNCPDLIAALVVFAQACRMLTKKDINPPVEFLRADMRLMQINRKKVRQVPLDPEEAIRALVDEKETAFIRDMNTWARAQGCSVMVRCTGVHKSEYSAIYRKTKPDRALFGFRTESGRLHMHLNFNQAERILPHIARAPLSFRELYYQRCECANCGACQDGPIKAELDGAVRRLCRYSYMNIPQVPSEHYETIKSLVKVQESILREEITK